MKHPSRRFSQRSLAVAGGLAAAAALAACDQSRDEPSAGQKLDAAIATSQQKGAELAAETREAGKEALQVAGDATADMANTAKDAAITAAVNAKLVADSTLSALKIDVDTENARVTLKGNAPDEAARARASELASQIDGVVAVDNQLMVAGKKERG